MVYDAPLSPEAAAALTRRTGGWAAGLQLFHLATASSAGPSGSARSSELNGRSRLIRSYLARNVLDGLAAERRRFLLRTAALGVLTGDLCDALLDTQRQCRRAGRARARAVLHHQHRRRPDLPLPPGAADPSGGAARRRARRPGGPRALLRAAPRLLEGAGRPAAAVRAHARAEDWGAVARLLRDGYGRARVATTRWGGCWPCPGRRPTTRDWYSPVPAGWRATVEVGEGVVGLPARPRTAGRPGFQSPGRRRTARGRRLVTTLADERPAAAAAGRRPRVRPAETVDPAAAADPGRASTGLLRPGLAPGAGLPARR